MGRILAFTGAVLLGTAISLGYQLIFGFARATNGVFELLLLLLVLSVILWWLVRGATNAQRRTFRLVSPAPRTGWLIVAYPLFTLFELCATNAAGAQATVTSAPIHAVAMRGVSLAAATAAGLLYAVLVGPLLEELVSRGLMLEQLRRASGPVVAVVVSAAAFALLHVDLPHFPMLLVTGLVYGWITLRSGSLGLTMVLHVAHNLTNHLLDFAGLPGTSLDWIRRTPVEGAALTLTLGVLSACHLARLTPIEGAATPLGKSPDVHRTPRTL